MVSGLRWIDGGGHAGTPRREKGERRDSVDAPGSLKSCVRVPEGGLRSLLHASLQDRGCGRNAAQDEEELRSTGRSWDTLGEVVLIWGWVGAEFAIDENPPPPFLKICSSLGKRFTRVLFLSPASLPPV